MRQNSYTLLALLLGVLALGLGLVACDSANPIAPSGSTLTVTANPTTIGLNQISAITIVGFKPDGNPLNPGSQVTVSTDLGVLDATVLSIDNNGRASTVLRPDGRTGPAMVTVALPAGEATAMAAVQIGESMETKPTLALTVSPNTIGLGETATVSTISRNADGSTLGAGGQVRLRTDLGTLNDENLVTDSNGEASTILNAGDTPGTASIVGSVDASDETMPVMVTIGETSETRPTLSITISPSTLDLGETAMIEVQARNADGSLFGRGGEVRLRTDLGTLAQDNLTTNSNGEASTTLNAGDTPGTATVTGSVDSSDEVTASVTIENQRPVLVISANPSIISVQESSEITIIARDNNGVALGSGERIRLTSDLGTLSGTEIFTDGVGEATVTYTADDRAGTGEVTAILGTSDPATVNIEIQDSPASFTFTVDTNSVPSGGGDVVLTATVVNAEGIALGGVLVRFESSIGGGFSPSQSVTTDTRGEARTTATFTSNNLPDSGGTFTVSATVRIGGADVPQSETITVQ